MSKKKLSRRDFLNLSAGATAASLLAACGAQPTPETIVETVVVEKEVIKEGETIIETVVVEKEVEKEVVVTATPAPMETVVLEIGASNPEYESPERQIWDVFEEQHPNIKVEVFSVNEDQRAGFHAKVAGGYVPAMAPSYSFVDTNIDANTVDQFLPLSEIDCPYWDRFIHDPINVVPEVYGWEARTIYLSAPHIFTWMYHKDLMDEAGLDPRNDVKTWDDLHKWLDEGTAWAKSNPDVEFFWDNAWHNSAVVDHQLRAMSMAFPDGQQEDNYQCYMDNANHPFNGEDSPFRHTFEFFKLAYDKGWLPENWWTREWEADMEASYIAKKSVMMLHGPWPWDKMLAADPSAEQLGLPATPPAEGQDVWMNYQGNVRYNNGQVAVLAAAKDLPEFPQIAEAVCWYHSPEAVAMRSQVLGRAPMYRLDEPLDLGGPQWQGVVKDMGKPGGIWEDLQFPEGSWGNLAAEPAYKPGTPGTWDRPGGGLLPFIADLSTGSATVQDILDWGQANFEESYDLA